MGPEAVIPLGVFLSISGQIARIARPSAPYQISHSQNQYKYYAKLLRIPNVNRTKADRNP